MILTWGKGTFRMHSHTGDPLHVWHKFLRLLLFDEVVDSDKSLCLKKEGKVGVETKIR